MLTTTTTSIYIYIEILCRYFNNASAMANNFERRQPDKANDDYLFFISNLPPYVCKIMFLTVFRFYHLQQQNLKHKGNYAFKKSPSTQCSRCQRVSFVLFFRNIKPVGFISKVSATMPFFCHWQNRIATHIVKWIVSQKANTLMCCSNFLPKATKSTNSAKIFASQKTNFPVFFCSTTYIKFERRHIIFRTA